MPPSGPARGGFTLELLSQLAWSPLSLPCAHSYGPVPREGLTEELLGRELRPGPLTFRPCLPHGPLVLRGRWLGAGQASCPGAWVSHSLLLQGGDWPVTTCSPNLLFLQTCSLLKLW